MDSHGGGVANPKHRTQGIRTRSQMRKGAQELEGMPLLLQRIVFGDRTDHLDAPGLQLEPLTLPGRIDECTGYRHRTTGLEVAQLCFEVFEFG